MRLILPIAALLLPAAVLAQTGQPQPAQTMNPTGPKTAPATAAPAPGSDTMSQTDSTMTPTPPAAADPMTAPDAATPPAADSNSTEATTDDQAPMTNKSKAKPKKPR